MKSLKDTISKADNLLVSAQAWPFVARAPDNLNGLQKARTAVETALDDKKDSGFTRALLGGRPFPQLKTELGVMPFKSHLASFESSWGKLIEALDKETKDLHAMRDALAKRAR